MRQLIENLIPGKVPKTLYFIGERLPGMRIDLHLHTTASDGLLDPAALVRAVHAACLDLFSVTDHDTLESLAEVDAGARAHGMATIPGIEISIYWRGVEFHILGYFVDPTDASLLDFLARMREARRARLRTMLSRLFAMGMAVTEDEVLALARDGNVGRPHVARALVRHGYVATLEEAFLRYLGAGRPAYVPRPDVTIREAVQAIRGAGGISSLAHPGLQNRDDAIPDLLAAGLDAIEVYHPKHTHGMTARYRRLARRRGLLVTGGSDFHGATEEHHGATPGQPALPEEDYLRLRDAAMARQSRVVR